MKMTTNPRKANLLEEERAHGRTEPTRPNSFRLTRSDVRKVVEELRQETIRQRVGSALSSDLTKAKEQ